MSDYSELTPMLGYVDGDENEGLLRFVSEDAADGIEAGHEELQAGRPGWVRAALVIDAFLHLPRGRTDALIVDAVEYAPQRRSLRMVVPYRPHTSPEGFAIYRPKFIEAEGFSEDDYASLAESFYVGVDSHEQAAIWNAHLLDESA